VLYISFGFVLFLALLYVSKLHYNEYFSPAAIFFFIFWLHAFIDPYLRLQFSPAFEPTSWHILTSYNIGCYIAILIGFGLHSLSTPRLARRALVRDGESGFELRSFLNTTTFKFLFFVGLGVMLLYLIALVQLGGLATRKGGLGSGEKATLQNVAQFINVILLVIPALFIASRSRWVRWRFAKHSYVLLTVLVFIQSVVIFGRQSILALSLLFLIVIHYRFRKINVRYIIAIFILVLSVGYFSLFRRAGVGILDLSIDQIAALTASGRVTLSEGFMMIVQSVPGQEVFSNVIPYFHFNKFWYGISYIESFFGRVLPLELLGWDRGLNPTFWYQDTILSRYSYGRDFSMVAESYMNFGYIGILVFLVLGIFLGFLNRKIYTSRSPVMFLWCCLMIVNLCISLRSDSNPLFARAIYPILPFIFLRWYHMLSVRNGR